MKAGHTQMNTMSTLVELCIFVSTLAGLAHSVGVTTGIAPTSMPPPTQSSTASYLSCLQRSLKLKHSYHLIHSVWSLRRARESQRLGRYNVDYTEFSLVLVSTLEELR